MNDVAARPQWTPSERQSAFLSSTAYEALYGGAAGGGKTQALVMGALRHIDKPTYNAIIFRRTFPELEGEVIPVSREWYPYCGGRYNAVQHCWYFPSGARIHFGHLQHETDVERYQGWQFQYVGYDELTHFTERQYTYIANSRVRSANGIPARVRAGTNPGGVGHEWVMKRWGPWLDPECKTKAAPGQKLYYRNGEDSEEWCEGADASTLSRVFVPALLEDNPHLEKNDPAYRVRMQGLDRVSRAQLLDGNWLAKPAAGEYFKRAWFTFVDAAPTQVDKRVRAWDLASSEGKGDWTVGVRLSRTGGRWCVEDVVRVRMRPSGVESTVKATADLDPPGTLIQIPQDPGQAGKAQVESYAKLLAGYNVRFERPTGDKVTRCEPCSAQVEARNFDIVRAHWNEPFLQSLEAFPTEGMHDDDVDALSDAFAKTVSLPSKFHALAEVSAGRRT